MTSVTIPSIRSWGARHLDDSYPAQLFPVVGNDEFAASIARLNAAYRPDTWMKVTQAICITAMVAGVVTFMIGVITIATAGGVSGGGGFPIPILAGFATLAIASILLAVYRLYASYVFGNRLLDALLAENTHYYANRLPPVQWKMKERELIWVRGGAYAGRSHSHYDVYVEVGAQVAQPIVHVHQHHNYHPQQFRGQAQGYPQSSPYSQGVAMEGMPPVYAPPPMESQYEVPRQQYNQTLL